MEEMPGEVELDMEVLVEVMMVEQVETAGWNEAPVTETGADLWTDSSHKVRLKHVKLRSKLRPRLRSGEEW